MSVLAVRGLTVTVRGTSIEVVRPVDLDVDAGQILGIVGESGSGKTTFGLALLGYSRRGLQIGSGSVRVGDLEVLRLSAHGLRLARGGSISYVPQDPAAALNPALTIGKHLRETLDAHGYGSSEPERDERVREAMREVMLPDTPAYLRRYPHQLSGGQQQRVVLAIAFACRPSVIVLDEPTTGLDVTTQAHVLATVRDLAKSHGVAAIYVTHDLAVVSSLADRIAVMYAGSVVEEATAAQIFEAPGHPYTNRLINAIPRLDGSGEMRGIPGRAPSPGNRPHGCTFEPRCQIAIPACRVALPEPASIAPGHRVRCIRSEEVHPSTPRATANAAAPEPALPPVPPLLAIRGLDAWYGDTEVLHSVDLSIDRGQCLALVGESGSGKTTLARIIAGLHRDYSGEVLFDGAPLSKAARGRPKDIRRRVQYVFQNPYSSLNPRRTIGGSISRPLSLMGTERRIAHKRVGEILELVSIPPAYAERFPDELSGGERQRVAIARALIAEPDLIICDEVTSALDVSVQATIIQLLISLQRDLGLSLLFVTHNLPLVRSIAARAAVMREGVIVESGPSAALLERPQDAYTKNLIANTPALTGA
ncbi:MAG: peptide/nickel transport system ATP-binding protein ddpF [Gaiellales bacterium]|nr:peptide/nickel transport system ATP-binding protein ddpF [Gaiellales bacterium]